jgi:superfamily I DNA/RNA helicase
MQADRLLDAEVSDVDGNVEDRTGTVSLFDGPLPQVVNAKTEALEQAEVAKWLRKRVSDGLRPDEMVLFVRSSVELPRAELAATAAGLPFRVLDTHAETTVGSLSLSTMHMAKGLEFRAVAVMACDDEVIPLQERIETATDASELEDVYNTERQLLYVACTRARDCLFVSSGGSPSEFLGDMTSRSPIRN